MKHYGKKLTRLLAILLCVGCLSQSVCFASDSAVETQENGGYPEGFDQTYEDDPDYLKQFGMMDTDLMEDTRPAVKNRAAGDPYTGLAYTHSDSQQGKTIIHGIDVSKWQGTVDWDEVKADGIEYVFIRCGYTNTGEIFYTNEDEKFRENVVGAYNAGLKVGIYYFSQAITVPEAQKEAEKTCNLLEEYRDMITMPVVYDFEKEANIQYRANGLGKEQGTQNVLAFCKIVEENGYTPYYYGSASELPKYYDLSVLDSYGCWIARYGQKTTYAGDYEFWQYTNSGRVGGIAGKVDCNFWYVDENDDAEEQSSQVTGVKRGAVTSTSVELSWNAVKGANEYEIGYSEVKGGSYTPLTRVPAAQTSYTVTDLTPSTGYSFAVRAYLKDSIGSYSDPCGTATKKEQKITIYTTNPVNLRREATASSEQLTTVPKNTMLDIRFRVKDAKGNTWYKVDYKANGTKYTGYLHGNYAEAGTRAKPTQSIYLRTGAGKNNAAQTVVKGKNKLILLSTQKDANGDTWYQVYTKKNGNVYTGYCMGKYIKAY